MNRKLYKVTAPVLLAFGLTAWAVPASAAPASNPADQTGEVHSCTTNGKAGVTTDNGGVEWTYDGYTGGTGYGMQYGVVHSYTTGGNANVYSTNGGDYWYFDNDQQGLFCSPP